MFDQLYKHQLKCQQKLSSNKTGQEKTIPIKHLYRISVPDLMRDSSRLLLGISSKCFILNQVSFAAMLCYDPLWQSYLFVSDISLLFICTFQVTDRFVIKDGLLVSGLSCQSLAGVCQVLVDAGTHYYRLNKLTSQQVPGMCISALLRSVNTYLTAHTACVLEKSKQARSPLHLTSLLRRHLHQLRYHCGIEGWYKHLNAFVFTGRALFS